MRDMFKTAEKAAINPVYDMSTFEAYELLRIARTGDYLKVINIAFRYGYSLGSKAEKKKAC